MMRHIRIEQGLAGDRELIRAFQSIVLLQPAANKASTVDVLSLFTFIENKQEAREKQGGNGEEREEETQTMEE